jgi:AcrR family transcriptional regulator
LYKGRVSPQRSNRDQLIEGTLRCLERLPVERITARVIGRESGANPASIVYHFGSKDGLVTEAVIEGLDRWLGEVATGLAELSAAPPAERYRRASEVVDATRRRHIGLASNFIGALARAQHDERVRDLLAAGFRRTRPTTAALLGLGDDPVGEDAAALVLALFYGLLLQELLDPDLAIVGERLTRAQSRLRTVMPVAPIRGESADGSAS